MALTQEPSICRRPLHSEEHAQQRRRMRELQRRHDEFRRLLLGDHSAFGLGPAILTSTQNPFVITDAATNAPVSRRVDVFCIMGRNKRVRVLC